MSDSRERIYTVVAMIPAGAVATYGQIAELAGLGRQARQVGYALAALGSDNPESDNPESDNPESDNPESENDVPWHRVVNAKGEISLRSTASGCEARQRSLLEREGVRFDEHGRIALSLYRWQP